VLPSRSIIIEMLGQKPTDDSAPLVHDGVGMLARGDVVTVLHAASGAVKRSEWLFSNFETLVVDGTTCVVLLIVGEGAKPPDQAARDHDAAAYVRVAPKLRRVVVLAEGGGFRNSLVRLVLSAYTRIASKKGLFVFADSLERALSLVQDSKSPDTPSTEQLMDGLTKLRAAVARQPGASLAPQ
jgi:hypothetical protein